VTRRESEGAAEHSTALRRPASRSAFWRMVAVAAVDLGPLRNHREFRLLYIGQLVSYFGNTLTTVALLYQVYALTQSPLAVGLFGMTQFVPLLLLAVVGGALADALDRRRMVQVTELALVVLSATLAINALLPTPRLWLLYLVGALAAGLDALQRPALTALVPRLVEREELVSAVALAKLRQSLGQIVGPALAGLLIATVGLPSTYGVDVATFVVSLLTLGLMRAVPPPHTSACGMLVWGACSRAYATFAGVRCCWVPTSSTWSRPSLAGPQRSSRRWRCSTRALAARCQRRPLSDCSTLLQPWERSWRQRRADGPDVSTGTGAG
jgi:MFS family permease